MALKIKKVIRKIKCSRVSSAEPIASLNLVREECQVPSDIPAKCHRSTSLGPELEKFVIREADLRTLMDRYFILDNIRLTIP